MQSIIRRHRCHRLGCNLIQRRTCVSLRLWFGIFWFLRLWSKNIHHLLWRETLTILCDETRCFDRPRMDAVQSKDELAYAIHHLSKQMSSPGMQFNPKMNQHQPSSVIRHYPNCECLHTANPQIENKHSMRWSKIQRQQLRAWNFRSEESSSPHCISSQKRPGHTRDYHSMGSGAELVCSASVASHSPQIHRTRRRHKAYWDIVFPSSK